jgi:hypothetical protein
MSNPLDRLLSNACAIEGARRSLMSFVVLSVTLAGASLHAQHVVSDPPPPGDSRLLTTARFLGGAALALGAHEAAHVVTDLAFGATPTVTRVDFHGLPFFAITPEGDLSRRERFTIASAGFWTQHAGSEWILTKTPDLRRQRAPVRKGMLAFNVLASAAYAGAAFAKTGPGERDTLGMADGARVDERVVGVLVLVPAVLDTVRYYRADAKWAVWASRGVKIGLVLLVVR